MCIHVDHSPPTPSVNFACYHFPLELGLHSRKLAVHQYGRYNVVIFSQLYMGEDGFKGLEVESYSTRNAKPCLDNVVIDYTKYTLHVY